MSIDPERWKSLWLLLSLDRIAPLWTDLWLPEGREVSLRTQLREVLAPYLDDERFFHEAVAINLEVLRATELRNGSTLVAFLRDWCRHVFVEAGPDRAQEALWSSICAAVGTFPRDVPVWVRKRCKAVAENQHRRRNEIQAKLEANSHRALDPWDERILPFSHGTVREVDTTVKVISGQNLFVLSWRDECSDLSLEELRQMAAAVQPFKEELGMEGVEIQIPGVWVHELADFLKAARPG